MALVIENEQDKLRGVAAADLAVGKLGTIDGNGKIALAANTSAGTLAYGVVPVGKLTGEMAALWPSCKVGGFSGLTVGGLVYLDINGGVTQAAPSAIGTFVQVVGKAISATEIQFNIGPGYEKAN